MKNNVLTFLGNMCTLGGDGGIKDLKDLLGQTYTPNPGSS